MKKITLTLGLVFQLIAFIMPTEAQILWLGEPGDLNQLRLERSPDLSPTHLDINPAETFEAKWSTPNKSLFFIGGDIDPDGIGIVLDITSRQEIVPGNYDTSWSSFDGNSLWLAVPPQYGNFGDMAIEPWMRSSIVSVREVEYKEEKLNKFAADFFVGGKDPDPTKWMWGQIRYNSSIPVVESSAVPEPETYAAVSGCGLAIFGFIRRRRRRRS